MIIEEKFVAYYRVSTQKQGRSGLGLEAQRMTVEEHLKKGSLELLAEFTEIETGTTKRHRPELEKALGHCRATGSILIVAKVDRLTRSVSFLHKVLDSGIEVRFCDLPRLEGPMGKYMLNNMASVAELEAGLISERTKAALQAAKARGVKLGNPQGAAPLLRYKDGYKHGVVALKEKADKHASNLVDTLLELSALAIERPNEVARELNKRGIKSPRAKKWYAASATRLLTRLDWILN